jgi:streptogramin lyase
MCLAVSAQGDITPAGLTSFRIVTKGATTFFELPKATQAGSITAGPEGSIWFSGAHAYALGSEEGVIGRVTVDGRVSQFAVPRGRSLGKIVTGPDGNLWFTELYANRATYLVARIGRISPAGEFREHRLGNHVGGVNSIAAGPDGNLWFTTVYWNRGRRRDAVGRITTSGRVTRFQLSPRSQPGAIVAGPDGNLWFTERGGGGVPMIGRITRSGRIRHFPLRRRNSYPRSITVGPDGNLWFTEGYFTYSPDRKNRIGRISTAGAITEFFVPGREGTGQIAAGPSGDIWFTTTLGDRTAIGSITPEGTVAAEPACLDAECELVPSSLAIGPEGALWFSAGQRFRGGGGGGSAIVESHKISQEAGFVGQLSP